MHWVEKFDLFLFDFDGLLVDTEQVHYQAYLDALQTRNLQTSLSFSQFSSLAHVSSKAWKEALYADLPHLSLDWDSIYRDKQMAYRERILSQKTPLMPGVEPLLKLLEEKGKRRCVVTHSTLDFVRVVRSHQPLLNSLPHWITREDYEKPKPDPECYLRAIQRHSQPGDRIIGFEDSFRGFKALSQTPSLSVLICRNHYPLLEMALSDSGGVHFESFDEIHFSE